MKNVIINIDYINDFHLDFVVKKKTNWTPIWNMDGKMMLKIDFLIFFQNLGGILHYFQIKIIFIFKKFHLGQIDK